jgi:biopolymer transport protein ExbB
MLTTATYPRPRLALLLLFCLIGFFLGGTIPALAPVAHAQEAGEGGDAAAPAAAKPKSSSHSPFEIFKHILTSVGIGFGLVFLFISIALVTIVVLLVMELRMGGAIPPNFVEDFTETVNRRKFKEAYEMCKDDTSSLARVLTTGMGRLQYGIEDAREAAFNMVDSIKAAKETLINYLATIGTLGPLLGLVGTVFGMILAFMELASPTGGGVDAKALAGAISHALVVTMLGIGLSVPAIFFHTFFRNRLSRLTHDVGSVADDLLTQMYHNSKKPGTASAAGMDVGPEAAPAAKPRAESVKQK